MKVAAAIVLYLAVGFLMRAFVQLRLVYEAKVARKATWDEAFELLAKEMRYTNRTLRYETYRSLFRGALFDVAFRAWQIVAAPLVLLGYAMMESTSFFARHIGLGSDVWEWFG